MVNASLLIRYAITGLPEASRAAAMAASTSAGAQRLREHVLP